MTVREDARKAAVEWIDDVHANKVKAAEPMERIIFLLYQKRVLLRYGTICEVDDDCQTVYLLLIRVSIRMARGSPSL